MTTQAISKNSKSDRTFERVLHSATKLFQDKGFQKTTMRDISRESRLGLGALYYYFDTKEELVLLFYERINDEILKDFRKKLESFKSYPETVEEFLKVKLHHLKPHRGLLRVVLKEAIDPESDLSPLSKKSSETLDSSLAIFEEIIRKTKAFPEDEVRSVSRGLWLLHMGVLAFWLHDKSESDHSTHRLIGIIREFLKWSARLQKIPGFGSFRKQILSLGETLFPKEQT